MTVLREGGDTIEIAGIFCKNDGRDKTVEFTKGFKCVDLNHFYKCDEKLES
jgi:hypothetical protein